ncbi:MAG TPA: hypothetical protein PKA27_10395, partial [Fimbriimonadaceae bacterium]|nr:hypothetical protein [Fimbriimonadaceae bacterium]
MKRIVVSMSIIAAASVSSGQSAGGTWSLLGEWQLFAIHMALLPTADHNGKLVVWNRHRTLEEAAGNVVERQTPPYYSVVNHPFTTGTKVRFPWDPEEFPNPFHFERDIFCAGQALTWDGKLFTAGGHEVDYTGLKAVTVFDPITNSWSIRADMAERRWYPTCYMLPNRRMIIMGGTINGDEDINTRPEMWMTGVGTNQDEDYMFRMPIVPLDKYYPHTFVDPTDGGLIVVGNGVPEDNRGINPNRKLNLATLQWSTWKALPAGVTNVRFHYASACMVDGWIVRSGGSRSSGDVIDPPEDAPLFYATNRTLFLNANDVNAQWLQGPGMFYGRKNHTLTVLPDRRILAVGGNELGDTVGSEIRTALEVIDPFASTPTWIRGVEPFPNPWRGWGYHSTALLMPSAKVIVSGGEGEFVGNGGYVG